MGTGDSLQNFKLTYSHAVTHACVCWCTCSCIWKPCFSDSDHPLLADTGHLCTAGLVAAHCSKPVRMKLEQTMFIIFMSLLYMYLCYVSQVTVKWLLHVTYCDQSNPKALISNLAQRRLLVEVDTKFLNQKLSYFVDNTYVLLSEWP